ncbi:helix-turn-helix domain-containing protein [Streptomyces sp. NPDC049879]|uniref:helix-turn-helix domain-containing protein n=1 Tax=Streptomyces sp. NPDC049879 TaxID=3365598 RepID=UPI0037B80841
MLHTVFDSQALPVADRLEAWHEAVSGSLVAIRMDIDRDEPWRAAMRAGALGAAGVSAVSYPSMRSARTPRMIRQSGEEQYMVVVPQRGRHVLDQAGSQTAIGPGGLAVIPMFRPYEGIVVADEGTADLLLCQVPRSLLPLPEAALAPLLGRRLPAGEGIGALLTDFLAHLDTGTGADLPGDGPRLEAVLLDLIAAMLAHHLEAEDRLPSASRQQALYLRVRDFVQRNLGDPRLTAGAIAAAHHISVRTLNRLFEEHGHSIAAHIRAERLEHARRDLAAPELADRPVQAIAARWGFGHPVSFTRAFRSAYGVPPREYRDQAHCGPRAGSRPAGCGAPGALPRFPRHVPARRAG